MDCSPPGSSVNGISQVRILEWVAISFSRGSSWSRIEPRSPALQADSLPTEPPRKPSIEYHSHIQRGTNHCHRLSWRKNSLKTQGHAKCKHLPKTQLKAKWEDSSSGPPRKCVGKLMWTVSPSLLCRQAPVHQDNRLTPHPLLWQQPTNNRPSAIYHPGRRHSFRNVIGLWSLHWQDYKTFQLSEPGIVQLKRQGGEAGSLGNSSVVQVNWHVQGYLL